MRKAVKKLYGDSDEPWKKAVKFVVASLPKWKQNLKSVKIWQIYATIKVYQ